MLVMLQRMEIKKRHQTLYSLLYSPINLQSPPLFMLTLMHQLTVVHHLFCSSDRIMDSINPHTKSLPKFVKTNSPPVVPWSPTARGAVRHVPPQQASRSPTWSRDELKERLYDKSKPVPKSPTKENTKPVEIKLHTQQRAVKRAMFNYSVATRLYLTEQQKKYEEKLIKMIEEEEIRMLRKEMIPRAQLMPLFDRPFFPQRSNRPLTVPREPSFHLLGSKSWSCISRNELYNFEQCQAMKPIK